MIAGDHEASHVSVRRKRKKKQWKEGCKQKKSHGMENLPGDSKWPFHPLVGGHLTPLKGSLNHPKKVTLNHQVVLALLGNPRFLFSPFLTDPSKSKSVISPQVVDGAEEVGFHSNGFGFGASEVRLKREKGSTQVDSLEFFLFFFVDFHFFSFWKAWNCFYYFWRFLGNWTTPGTAFVFVFFSCWLPAQSSFFPVGLGPPLCSFLWAMPPAGMGATGRYEACGMLDFDCMAGWQPVLTIFQCKIHQLEDDD